MRKGIFWTGFVVFVLAAILYVFSVSEYKQPAIIGENEAIWLSFAMIGLAAAMIGAIAKPPKKAVRKARAKKRRK
jgi:hypothetical protein